MDFAWWLELGELGGVGDALLETARKTRKRADDLACDTAAAEGCPAIAQRYYDRATEIEKLVHLARRNDAS